MFNMLGRVETLAFGTTQSLTWIKAGAFSLVGCWPITAFQAAAQLRCFAREADIGFGG
jgi:hypothetical protein